MTVETLTEAMLELSDRAQTGRTSAAVPEDLCRILMESGRVALVVAPGKTYRLWRLTAAGRAYVRALFCIPPPVQAAPKT